MAEALLKNSYGDYYEVFSAGSQPREINPLTIEVLGEIDIDISQNKSKSLSIFQGQDFDYVASLCGNKDGACPVFIGGKTHLHQGFPDPREFEGDNSTQLDSFRNLRDEIEIWIKKEFKIDI